MITVAISGGFDPLHVGHIRYIQEASQLGDRLTVILNGDAFLKNKKGYIFMPVEERKEVIAAIRGVDYVFECVDKDNTVCESLKILKPNIFAKGGDKTIENIPEVRVCEELNIKMVFGVGGSDKPQSSSWMVEKFIRTIKENNELRTKFKL